MKRIGLFLLGILSATMMSADQFAFDAARGSLNGVRHVNKFGRATNVDAVDTDIWDGANATTDQDVWAPPTAARIHTLVSTSDNDDGDPAGTGAHVVTLYGLDADWLETSESVTLNGSTGTATTKTYIRIFRMIVTAAGSGGTNAGIIISSAAVDGTTTAQINAGEGQTQMAIYTIPADARGYMTGFYASLERVSPQDGKAAVSLLARENADSATSLFVVKHVISIDEGGVSVVQHLYDPYKVFGPKTDVKLQAYGSTTDLDVSGGFDIILQR